MRLPNYHTAPRGIYGSGQNGPAEMDWRGSVAGDAQRSRTPEYCRHTGSDFWPRPCDDCLRRSEAGQSRKVQP